MRQLSMIPTRKVASASIAAPISVLFLWWLYPTIVGEGAPEWVTAAFAALITALTGYFVPPSPRDGVTGQNTSSDGGAVAGS